MVLIPESICTIQFLESFKGLAYEVKEKVNTPREKIRTNQSSPHLISLALTICGEVRCCQMEWKSREWTKRYRGMSGAKHVARFAESWSKEKTLLN